MAEKEVDVKAEKKSAKADKASEKTEKKAKDIKKTDDKKNKKPNVFARIAKYFRECKAEVRKITWPTSKSVFKNCGIEPEKYTGFAFGFGLDRIAMLRHEIPEIGLITSNDQRFLSQF